jgi:hypothetical protein
LDRPNLSFASIDWYWDGLDFYFPFTGGSQDRPNLSFASIDWYWDGQVPGWAGPDLNQKF